MQDSDNAIVGDYEKLTEENMQEYAKMTGAVRDYITFLHDVRKVEPQAIHKLLREAVHETFLQEQLTW
jgi:hypothetical protein